MTDEARSDSSDTSKRLDHRADCQLYTVPTYGLCTRDFDARKKREELDKAYHAGKFKDYDFALPNVIWLLHELELMQERLSVSTERPTQTTEAQAIEVLAQQYDKVGINRSAECLRNGGELASVQQGLAIAAILASQPSGEVSAANTSNSAETAAIAMREAAAKEADRLEDEWAKEWRKGLKADSYLEAKSDGAGEVAIAIRALPIQQSVMKENENG